MSTGRSLKLGLCVMVLLILGVVVNASAAPVLKTFPQLIQGPAVYEKNDGFVRIVVMIDNGLIGPLQNAKVILMDIHCRIYETRYTDESGQTWFFAPAGFYMVRVYNELDYRDRYIEIIEGVSIEPQYFVFSYNPTPGSFGTTTESDLDCPGMMTVTVMEEQSGLVVLSSETEVQLVQDDGVVLRTAYTNMYGQATFVIEKGFYHVTCNVNGEYKSQWILIPCGQHIDYLKFYF